MSGYRVSQGGSRSSTRRTNPKRDIPMIAQLYPQGRYTLDELVSKTISIDEVPAGYASLRDPKINRVVVTSF